MTATLIIMIVMLVVGSFGDNGDAAKTSRSLLSIYDGWTTSNVRMPYNDQRIAVGSIDETIYLLGGENYHRQLTVYNIAADKMLDAGQNNLSSNMSDGTGQYFSAINNMVYVINGFGEYLSTFNLETALFVDQYADIPVFTAGLACLVASEMVLYVVGGDTDLQIFFMTNYSWTSSSSLNQRRQSLTCNLHPVNNILYAIGGDVDAENGSVEYIDTTNINIHSWQYIDGQLVTPTHIARSVIYGNSILIIGGSDGHNVLDIMQVLDIKTGMISNGGTMNYGVVSPSVIIVNDIIYVFGGYGGYGGGQLLNTWQYLILPQNPSPTPSPSPTIYVIIGCIIILFIFVVVIYIYFKKKVIANNDGIALHIQHKGNYGALQNDEYNEEEKESEIRNDEKRQNMEYTEWSSNEVIEWIISLENGRFHRYKKKLQKIFKKQHFDGSCIDDVEKSDITEWRITDFRDKTSLFQHIKNLQNQRNVAVPEGNVLLNTNK